MKKILLLSAAFLTTTAAFSQSAIDAYRISQPDMKGTARFMSMGGAFTALGGDLSTLSQNPAGIGVYRNSDIGFTLDLDMQHSTGESLGFNNAAVDQTKFLLNNIGFVWSLKLPSESCPNINFGFTYNKSVSYNRRYAGAIGLTNDTQSLSNLVANVSTLNGYSPDMLAGDNSPYNPSEGYGADWLSILGYNSYLISPTGSNSYEGQWRRGETTGFGLYDVMERGGVDSYNIAFGGNISNVVYWGMDFDITHMNYTLTPNWEEVLTNAAVGNDMGTIDRIGADWTLSNYYNCSGTGFNYKLGLILKPIQEFRIGFAFHTPTWYTLTEQFSGSVDYSYGPFGSGNNQYDNGYATTDDGYMSYNDVNFRTPWRITAGAAAVLFNRLILSADYEWAQYSKMKYSNPTYNGGGYWSDPWDDPWYPWYAKPKQAAAKYISQPYLDAYYETNQDIQYTYQNTNTLRLGAEFRLIPEMSLRAGYAHVSSPVKSEVKGDPVITAGTIPNYRFDNETNYVTLGLGFNFKGFYVDAAYIYKQMESVYHAYSPWDNEYGYGTSPTSKLHLSNSQVVLSMGYKF